MCSLRPSTHVSSSQHSFLSTYFLIPQADGAADTAPTKILAASAISPHSQETQGSKFDELKEGLRPQEESWLELPAKGSLWRAGGPRVVALSPCTLGPGPYGQSERRYSLLWHPTLAEERHMTGAVQPDRVAQRPEGPRTETLTKSLRQPNRNWTHP